MKLKDVDLLKLQTSFMQRDPTTQGLCAGLTPELRAVANKISSIIIFQTLDELEDNDFAHALLDELAWQFHVDFYDKSASMQTKRNLVKQSITIHKTKGTPKAVEDLVNAAFPNTNTIVVEWFNYAGGQPYHFKLRTDAMRGKTTEEAQRAQAEFMRGINSVKNVRSWLDGIEEFTIVYMMSKNLITFPSVSINYAKTPTVSAGEFQALAFGDGTVLNASNGEAIGFLV